MFELGLKLAVSLLGYIAAGYGEWSTKRRRVTFLTAVYAIAATASASVLVYDHVDQAERTAA